MTDHVLFAHDLSDRMTAVADTVEKLARRFDCGVTVLSVVADADMREQRESLPGDQAYVDVVLDEIRSRITEHPSVQRLHAAEVPTRIVVLRGEPDDELLRHLDTTPYEFVVLGVRRRSRVGKFLFGSVAQSVLLASPHPVVAVPCGD